MDDKCRDLNGQLLDLIKLANEVSEKRQSYDEKRRKKFYWIIFTSSSIYFLFVLMILLVKNKQEDYILTGLIICMMLLAVLIVLVCLLYRDYKYLSRCSKQEENILEGLLEMIDEFKNVLYLKEGVDIVDKAMIQIYLGRLNFKPLKRGV